MEPFGIEHWQGGKSARALVPTTEELPRLSELTFMNAEIEQY
jgi:hypothetical protein